MPKEPTTEVVRGCLYTWMLIGRLDGRTPPEITLITSLIIATSYKSSAGDTYTSQIFFCAYQHEINIAFSTKSDQTAENIDYLP